MRKINENHVFFLDKSPFIYDYFWDDGTKGTKFIY